MEQNSKLDILVEGIADGIDMHIEFNSSEEREFFIENVVEIIINSDEDSVEENINEFLAENYDNPEELKETLNEGISPLLYRWYWRCRKSRLQNI